MRLVAIKDQIVVVPTPSSVAAVRTETASGFSG